MIAGVLAAGCDGLERGLEPPPMSEGDMYTNPGDCAPLPATLVDAIAAYRDSALAENARNTVLDDLPVHRRA